MGMTALAGWRGTAYIFEQFTKNDCGSWARQGRKPIMRMLSALALGALLATPAFATTDQERIERWNDLRTQLLGERAGKVQPAGDGIAIDAPVRAEDAALVPIALTLTDQMVARKIKKLYLVIDDNPAPLAGIWEFGPAGDPHRVATRVRVEDYTYVHAIAETQDGALYEASRFVKATGGCSAPAGGDQQEAMARLGKIKMALHGAAGAATAAQVMISHPNNNGMQMDQVTRNYVPANFIQKIDVTYNDAVVFKMQSDISMSENPTVEFGFKATQPGTLNVDIHDSNAREFKQSLPVDLKPQS
jgi:sulfur-oxidizing protein SoxY